MVLALSRDHVRIIGAVVAQAGREAIAVTILCVKVAQKGADWFLIKRHNC